MANVVSAMTEMSHLYKVRHLLPLSTSMDTMSGIMSLIG